MRVAVVASRQEDSDRLKALLEKVGYEPLIVSSVCEAMAVSLQPAATIVCHRMSLGEPVPTVPPAYAGQRLIILSDCQSESVIVRSLDAGAHHYLLINESTVLLQARLEAALRRHFMPSQTLLVVKPFTFDLEKRQVRYRDKPIDLSPKEYEFAYYLFTHRGRIVTNDELMTSVWSLPRSMDTRRIDTAACRVRKKMLQMTDSGWRLRRLRSVGYELHPLLVGNPVDELSQV